MEFSTFSNKITKYKNASLGGQSSQFKLAPKVRIEFPENLIKISNPRKAAVLALFYPDKHNRTRFLLTKRATYSGKHSNQISFVGGKKEENETLKQTAIRESFEEVNLPPSEVKIIRKLSKNYIPPSNFMITPFLGYTLTKPNFTPNREVAEIMEILVEDLLDDSNISYKKIETSYLKELEVPCFVLNEQIVWGATAMILSEIKDLLKSFQ